MNPKIKQFLVVEQCNESSACPYKLDTYFIEATSLEEAQTQALKNVEDYFYLDTVERRFQSHQVTIHQVAKSVDASLKNHIANWIQRKKDEQQQKREQQEREEFERLKQKFVNG